MVFPPNIYTSSQNYLQATAFYTEVVFPPNIYMSSQNCLQATAFYAEVVFLPNTDSIFTKSASPKLMTVW